MTDCRQNLMRQLLAKNAQAIVQRLLDDCVNQSKTHPPVQLERSMCERHWEEIKVIAHHWGGPVPFDYDEIERVMAEFFADRLVRLPAHEQATLCMGLMGVDDLPEDALNNASKKFQLDGLRTGQILNVLLEDLMSFVAGGHAPDAYEPTEVEEFIIQVDFMESRLKYFRDAHQELARSHAIDLRQSLVAELRTCAKNTPAFNLTDEGCRSHWDEICVMSQMGGDHALYWVLMSTLDESAMSAINALPEEERYALWANSRTGQDWVENCDWKEFPVDLHMNNDGLIEAAETVRAQLLSSASNATFYHDEIGEQSRFSKEDDIKFLQTVADGRHPLMLEPELANLINEAYLRRADDSDTVALVKQAVDAYTKAMLDATNHLAP